MDPATIMTSLNARTDPNADPMIVKEAPAEKTDESPSLRLKPGVFLRAPQMLFKVLRHDPARWRREERSFRSRLDQFQHRAAQASSLDDKDLAHLVEGIVGLFRTCLRDGAMYYGLGLVWMYWRTARLLKKQPDADDELAESIAAYFLQLLLIDRSNPLAPLFEHFRRLSEDTQAMDLQQVVVSIPESAFDAAETATDIENIIFAAVRRLPRGAAIESRVDALLAGLPIRLEKLDWPFSPRPVIPFRLLVALLSSEPIDGLDDLLTDEDTAKQVARKLPFRKRARWKWNVTKTRKLMTGAVGTIFLLLETIPVFHLAFGEVAKRLQDRNQVAVSEDLMLLRFDEILKALENHESCRELVIEHHREHLKHVAARRARKLEAKAAGEIQEDDTETPVSLDGLTSES